MTVKYGVGIYTSPNNFVNTSNEFLLIVGINTSQFTTTNATANQAKTLFEVLDASGTFIYDSVTQYNYEIGSTLTGANCIVYDIHHKFLVPPGGQVKFPNGGQFFAYIQGTLDELKGYI